MTNGKKATALLELQDVLRSLDTFVTDVPERKEFARRMIFKKTSNEGLLLNRRFINIFFKITFETKENGETVVTGGCSRGIYTDWLVIIQLFNEEPQIGKEVEAILNHYYNIYQMSKNGLLEDDE